MTFCLATASFRVILSLPVSSRGPTEFRSSSRTLEPSAADPSRATFPDFLRAGSRTIAQAFVNATARETGIERGDRETTASYFCLFFFFFFLPLFRNRATNERTKLGNGKFRGERNGYASLDIRNPRRTTDDSFARNSRGTRRERERERAGTRREKSGRRREPARGKRKEKEPTKDAIKTLLEESETPIGFPFRAARSNDRNDRSAMEITTRFQRAARPSTAIPFRAGFFARFAGFASRGYVPSSLREGFARFVVDRSGRSSAKLRDFARKVKFYFVKFYGLDRRGRP